MKFTHLTQSGDAYMVDVTAKTPTVREATAIGKVECSPTVMQALRDGTVPKGDVLAVARIAGIAAAKRVPQLLPLAHTARKWICNCKKTTWPSLPSCVPPTAPA